MTRAAFAQWQAIPRTAIRFEEAGVLTSKIDVNTQDHTNAVYWAKGSTLIDGGKTDIRGILAQTFTSRIAGTAGIAEADIVLNGVQFNWFTDFSMRPSPPKTRFFVEGVALYEIGHLLGLAHSTVGGATMVSHVDVGGNGVLAGLSLDEIAFAKHTYRDGGLGGSVPVSGAAVVLEDGNGSIVAGSITRRASVKGPDGHFLINGVPPGDYRLQALPLDPGLSPPFPPSTTRPFALLLAVDILSEREEMERVDMAFRPSANLPVVVAARQTAVMNITVEAGEPSFRISAIGMPAPNYLPDITIYSGVVLRLGVESQWVSVFGRNLPLQGISLGHHWPGRCRPFHRHYAFG